MKTTKFIFYTYDKDIRKVPGYLLNQLPKRISQEIDEILRNYNVKYDKMNDRFEIDHEKLVEFRNEIETLDYGLHIFTLFSLT